MEFFADDARPVASFATNLRVLCESRGSVSEICRKAKINRQQFNKYLAGKHMPSAVNARRIAAYFGFSPEVLFLDPSAFRSLIDGNFFETFQRLRRQPLVATFLSAVIGSGEPVAQSIEGVYERYQYSSIYPRSIIRASFCIYRGPDFLQHTYIERFPSYDDPHTTAYTFRYNGFVVPIDGRVFTIDFETMQRNELTFGILSSVQRSSKRFMFGITSGIAANMFRQPYSTRLALHYRRPGMLTRQDLESTTALDMNDPSIPREIQEYLGDVPDMVMPQ
ncbi:helix-turn-helix transcriptional regulator [Devosia sp.]|jgi:transcriptional regulator with XRE-family HTH domain|uniref:helix-turn-helix transcriptional regulator n=1 Tax=Devosia sp. TaxID=1871048 RepID=UPI0037BF0124